MRWFPVRTACSAHRYFNLHLRAAPQIAGPELLAIELRLFREINFTYTIAMHCYVSGIESYHDEHASEVAVIGGFRLATQYPDTDAALRLCDISHRPQILFEGNKAQEFLQDVLGFEGLQQEHKAIRHNYKNEAADIDAGFLCANIGHGRFYMVINAIYDNDKKDDIVNWMADEMLDDMTFTMLKDYTLLGLKGQTQLPEQLPKPGQSIEKQDKLVLNSDDEILVAMTNDAALPFWNTLINTGEYAPIGLYSYEPA